MSNQLTSDNQTTPLLGHRRTDSYQTLVANESTPKADSKQAPRANLVWTLVALWSAIFLGALDGTLSRRFLITRLNNRISITTGTVVATLLSPIGGYFNRSNQSSYIGTAYLLSVCCFTPLYGRLSDILGRKGAMLLALSFFGLGTLLCGVAPSMNVLIAARAIAGMGGGGLVPKFHVFIGLNSLP